MDSSDDCVHFQPFSHYDWTFARVGWLKWNPIAFCLIAAFCAVAYLMCIELIILVYVTFKRHSGLYFWSIIITTCGIALQTTGYILKEFKNDCPPILTTIICKLGWVSNVTGFSIVLWSRLHLVVRNPQTLRLVLIMIIVDGILLHTPVVVFEFGLISRHHSVYVHPMEIMERIQQTVFTCQESIISGLYIYHTWRFLKSGYASHTRIVIGLLVAVQTLVILLDAGLTTFDYHNMFTLKCTVHPFVYSVKLKLEFIVLNQLLTLVKRGMTPGDLPNLNLASDLKASPDSASEGPPTPSPTSSQLPPNPKRHSHFFPHSFRLSPKSAPTTTTPPSSGAPPATATLQAALASGLSPSSEKDVAAATQGDVSVESSPQVLPARHDSEQTLHNSETDLFKIVGATDEDPDEPAKDVDDIERQYLGRFGL